MVNHKILVPVDGSDCSIHALEYAVRRRKTSEGVEILVLNVQPSMLPSSTLTRSLIGEYQTRNFEEAMKPVRAALKRLRIEARCHKRIGNPARTIVEFAQSKRCTEIAMGNNGLGAIADIVLGSVARKVIALARVPVVLVK